MKNETTFRLLFSLACGIICSSSVRAEPVLSSTITSEVSQSGIPPYFATVDVTGIPSKGARDSPDPTVLSIWVGPQSFATP